MANYYDLVTSKGVLIDVVVEDAPADLANLRRGDIIINVDGVATTEPNDIERVLAKHKPDDKLPIKIFRGRQVRELTLKLQELPRLEHLPKGII